MPRNPEKRRANDLRYRTAHREQRNDYFRQYNSDNRQQIKARNVTRWDKMFSWPIGTAEWALAVSFICLICGESFDDSKMMGKAIDHNHVTGGFRGVIHNRCNVGIGHLRDSADLCLKAAAYLKAA